MGWSYTVGELAKAIGAATPKESPSFSSVSTDTRTLKKGDLFFALFGERFDGNSFVQEAFKKGAAAAVTTAAVESGLCVLVSDPLAALQRFAAYHRSRYTPLVFAITGSVGKTTSKDLTAAVLASTMSVVKTKGNRNNEIGCPLSLLQIDAQTDAAIIEMGAAKLGNIAELCAIAKPIESVITLVAPAHLEGFGTIETVAATKGEIAEALPPDGVFYVNVDNPWCVQAAERHAGEKVRFGSHGDVVLKSIKPAGNGEFLLAIDPVGKLLLPLPSRAHAVNVLIAIAAGLRHRVSEFEGALRQALSEPSRFRIVEINGLEIIDDTYNASPASMAAALEGLRDRPGKGARIAALGDMLELGPESARYHSEIGSLAGRLKLDAVFAFGNFASAMIDAARASGVTHTEVFSDHRSLAEAVRATSTPGDLILVKGSRGMRMEIVIDVLRKPVA